MSNEFKKSQCIIYVRVSDPSQVDGTSLDTQEQKCREYADAQGFEVVKLFREEGVSAKIMARPEFTDALEYLKASKGKIKHFIIYKIDRISRNVEDQFEILKTLREAGAEMRSVSENIDATPAGQLLRNMLWAFADFDNKIRAERCLNGSIARFKQGYWTHTPPPGYLMVRDPLTKLSMATPDKERARHITWAYEQRALGHTFEEIANGMNTRGYRSRKGRKMTQSNLERILKHPFYMGLMVSYGLEIEGRHEPIVGKELWYRVQSVGKQKSINNGRRILLNPLFPLRRFVYCHPCKQNMTGSAPQGRLKKHYEYYHHHNPACSVARNIKKSDLENMFRERLNQLKPKPEYLALVKAVVLDVWKERIDKHLRDHRISSQQIEALMQEKSNLLELKRKNPNLYSDEEFLEQKKDLDVQINNLRSERYVEDEYDRHFEEVVERAFSYFIDIAKRWDELDIASKTEFQRMLMPEGLPFDGQEFGNHKISLILELLEAASGGKSDVVDMGGIEPP